MNQEKIGKFIALKRKEKNMTQEELAERLGVNNRTISRWENGNYMPDLSLLKILSEELGVSLNELLNGEETKGDDKVDKTLENTIAYSNEKIRKNKRSFLVVILFLIILIFLLLLFFFIRNYNSNLSYTFTGESDNFSFDNGLVTFSKDKGYIQMSNFKIKDGFNTDKVSSFKMKILFDNEVWADIYWDNNDKESLDEVFKTMRFGEVASFNQDCSVGCTTDSFSRSNKDDFPNNLKVQINYCFDDKCKNEVMKIGSEFIGGNKFF